MFYVDFNWKLNDNLYLKYFLIISFLIWAGSSLAKKVLIVLIVFILNKLLFKFSFFRFMLGIY